MESAPYSKPRHIIIFSPAAERTASVSTTNSTTSLTEDLNKYKLLNLTPSLIIPSTPARETSEYFDSLNNLDPIKFSPQESSPTIEAAVMTDL